MKEKLELMSIGALVTLRQKVDEVIKSKQGALLGMGKCATFSHNGRRVFVRIVKVNQKTFSCQEVDEYGRRSGGFWRVGKTLVLPYTPKEREMVSKVSIQSGGKEDAPQTVVTTW